MCGRLFQTLPLNRLMQIAQAANVKNPQHYSCSYNVCPTSYIPTIKTSPLQVKQNIQSGKEKNLLDQKNRQMQFMQWGYKTRFNFIVNGRIEQMLEKRTFLKLINNRCVIIMSGYYQWNAKKQPFSFKPKDTDHFLVAALYTDQNQVILLTKDATPQLSAVHHRMPVILSQDEVNIWLNPKNTIIINQVISKSLLRKQKQVCKSIGFAKLAPYVSSIKEKSEKCLMTIQQYRKQLDKTGLMRFWKKAPQVQSINKQGQIIKICQKQKSPQKMIQQQEPIDQNKSQHQLKKRDIILMNENNGDCSLENQQDLNKIKIPNNKNLPQKKLNIQKK